MAILAGDALLNLAYETASQAFDLEPGNPTVGKAFQILSAKTGMTGMIGGQSGGCGVCRPSIECRAAAVHL